MTIYQQFFEAYYQEMKEYFLEHYEGDLVFTAANYEELVRRPATIAPELGLLKPELSLQIPGHFLAFYGERHTYESLSISLGINIATSSDVAGTETISSYLEGINTMMDLGLLPFGTYQDEWIICLNTIDEQDADNPAIYLFEIGLWDTPEQAVSPKPWFSSFDAFILCMTDYLISGNTDQFAAIDPANHFYDAYPYWDHQ